MYSSTSSLDYLDGLCHSMDASHMRDGFKIHSHYKGGLLSARNFRLKLLTLHASKEQFETNIDVIKRSQIPETAITCTSKMNALSDTISFPFPLL